MTKKLSQKYAKPKMICPFCQERKADGNFRDFSVNGISMHIRQIHPEHYDEFQTHRKKFVEEFACDDTGVLLKTKPVPKPEPKIEPSVAAPAPSINTEAIPIDEQVHSGHKEIPAPPPKATPPPAKSHVEKPEPKDPQKGKFQDDPEPKSRGYDPYTHGY